ETRLLGNERRSAKNVELAAPQMVRETLLIFQEPVSRRFLPHRSSRPTDACGAGILTGPGGPDQPSWHSTLSLGSKLLFKKPVIYPPQRRANSFVPAAQCSVNSRG